MRVLKLVLILIVISLLFIGCGKDSSTGPAVQLAAVILQSPENEALLNTDSVLFEWDEVEGAESYELVVDSDSTFSSPIVAEQEIIEISYQAEMPDSGVYFWKIRAEGGEWSKVWLLEVSFTHGKVTDIDGNVYNTIKIGNQWWMAENLKVIHYRNGDPIPNVADDAEWRDMETGARCVIENDEDNANTYGYLYNWYAVNDSRNISPPGWHVPTDEEWQELVDYLGQDPGSKLAGQSDLWGDDILKNNAAFGESGFCALPGGYRSSSSIYYLLTYSAYFWSSTERTSVHAWYQFLRHNNLGVLRDDHDKGDGFSIRLVRDRE